VFSSQIELDEYACLRSDQNGRLFIVLILRPSWRRFFPGFLPAIGSQVQIIVVSGGRFCASGKGGVGVIYFLPVTKKYTLAGKVAFVVL
jgi:hypothetical protein